MIPDTQTIKQLTRLTKTSSSTTDRECNMDNFQQYNKRCQVFASLLSTSVTFPHLCFVVLELYEATLLHILYCNKLSSCYNELKYITKEVFL